MYNAAAGKLISDSKEKPMKLIVSLLAGVAALAGVVAFTAPRS